MKPFIGVVGHANAGKSTIIQSLTGCKTRTGIRLVRDAKTGKEVLVFPASPQENRFVDRRFKQELRDAARRRSTIGIVAAIQPTWPYARLSLEDMVNAAKLHGLQPYLFVVDPPYSQTSHSHSASLSRVRKRVGRSVRLGSLDGRRFAHLNAKRVARLTRLFRS